MRHLFTSCLGITLVLASPQAWSEGVDSSLLDLELNQLLALPVSVVSRAEQRMADATAAVYVIDRETLRRSGVQRLPDALRLVPGLHVGKWDANKWAVSSRNAMSRFTSTMLLLVDGRPGYTPLFGGVRWETIDLSIDEIERIEVVRGPGGPLWGANAVDGIVSIVTRRADTTVGQRAALGFGQGDIERLAEARTGHALGDGFWRLSLRWMDSAPGLLPPAERSVWTAPRAVGEEGRDEGVFRSAMLRYDRPADAIGDAWNVWLGRREGRFSDQRVVGGRPVDNQNWFDLDFAALEWRQGQPSDRQLIVRASMERLHSGDDVLVDRQSIADLDVQQEGRIGRHEWTWGFGLNHYRSDTRTPGREASPPCTGCFGALPQVATETKRSLFAQTRTALDAEWTLIAGAKLEDSRSLDAAVQPTVRVRWQPEERGTFWGGWTRVLRSSTRLERDGVLFNVPANLAPAFGCTRVSEGNCLVGNASVSPWRVDVAEFGWRGQVLSTLSLDATAFHSTYENVSRTPGARVRDRVQGAEVVAQWMLFQGFGLKGSLTWHEGKDRFIGQAGSSGTFLLPRLSGQVHLKWSPHAAWDIDLRGWTQDEVSTSSSRIGLLPGHRRFDARVSWRPAPGWETALSIGNVNDPRVVEYVEALRVNTAVPRSISVTISRTLP